MNYYRPFLILVLVLIGTQGMKAAEKHQLIQLHEAMRSELKMTIGQQVQVWKITREYWTARTQLFFSSNTIGPNTAILACWDNWRRALSEILTATQMKKFIQWQSQVDLLGETPY